MAKEIKNKKTAETQQDSYWKYVFISAVVLLIGYFVYTNYIQTENPAGNKSVLSDPQERIKNIKEPAFKKEGELEFLKKDGKSEIKKIDIELAENDDERMQGLMYRKTMDDTRGMLFIFQREESQSFWMKNTIMPLDIIYVNSKKEIVKIYKHTTPFSEKSLPSEKPVTYVVEVAAGYTDRYGISEGDKIEFQKMN